MTGELSTSVKVKVLLLNKKTENTHNQISEVPTQSTLIQILLSPASTTMTGPTTGEPSTSVKVKDLLPNKKAENTHNQTSEVPTQSTLIQIQLSQASTTTTGPTIGELPTSVKVKVLLSKLSLKSIHNQTSEVPTHRTLTLIALSLLTYITTGLTTGITMSIERETIVMITISLLTSITISSKPMPRPWSTHNQTLEDKTHRTPTLISLSLPTYTTTGLTTGTTTSTEKETIEMITISLLTSTTLWTRIIEW